MWVFSMHRHMLELWETIQRREILWIGGRGVQRFLEDHCFETVAVQISTLPCKYVGKCGDEFAYDIVAFSFF